MSEWQEFKIILGLFNFIICSKKVTTENWSLPQMDSSTLKPSLFLSKLSSSSASASTILVSAPPSATFPRKVRDGIKGRLALRIRAYDSSKDNSASNSGDAKPPNGTLVILFFFFPYLVFLTSLSICMHICNLVDDLLFKHVYAFWVM